MAKADKEKRLKMAKDLVGKGIGRNEAARQIAKRFKISLDSAKGDVRAACGPADGPSSTASMKTKRPAKEPEAAPPEVKEAEKGETKRDAGGLFESVIDMLQRREMPPAEQMMGAINCQLGVLALTAEFPKDRISAARALSKNMGFDSPEYRQALAELKRNKSPMDQRLAILKALGLGVKK